MFKAFHRALAVVLAAGLALPQSGQLRDQDSELRNISEFRAQSSELGVWAAQALALEPGGIRQTSTSAKVDAKAKDTARHAGLFLSPTARSSKEAWRTTLVNSAASRDGDMASISAIKRFSHFASQATSFHPSTESTAWAASAFRTLPSNEQQTILRRLELLGAQDAHGLRRCLLDIAWLAASEIIQRHGEIISLETLVHQLGERETLDESQRRQLVQDLSSHSEVVRQRLAMGRGILAYGVEIRFDPIEETFIFRQEASLQGFRKQALIIEAPPRIVISVLIFNGWVKAQRLLESLKASGVPPNVEIVVMDNGSNENHLQGLLNLMANSPCTVTAVRSPRNLGYAEGHNAIIDRALDIEHADAVLLINNDLDAGPGFLEQLAEVFARGVPQVPLGRLATVGAMIFQEHQGMRTSYVRYFGHRFPVLTPRNLMAYLRRPHAALEYPEIYVSDYNLGPVLGLPAKTLRLIGHLDERFFAYGEELDYGLRTSEAGLESVAIAAAQAWHEDGSSSKGRLSGLPWKFFIRNLFFIIRKHSLARRPLLFLGLLLSILRTTLYAFRLACQRRDPRIAIGVLLGFIQAVFFYMPDTQAGSLEIIGHHSPMSPAHSRSEEAELGAAA